MTLLLTMITATGAWADMPADGSAENPYIINNATDWATFAADINAGTNTTACYKLADDFDNSSSPVSAMVGSQANAFRGTFDGNGKTLYVNIESDKEGAAPFHYVNEATIKNLTVAGTITSTAIYAAGMVGFMKGSNSQGHENKITDCVVTATITSSDSYIGGFIGKANANDGYNWNSVYFTNCVFAGTISYNGTGEPYYVGAFFGYGSETNDNFENCLEIGHYNNIPKVSPRGGNDSSVTATSLYYVNKIGNPSRINEDYGCFQVLAAAPAKDMYLARTIKGYTCYQPATLSGLMDKYAYNNGNAVSLSYALRLGKTAMAENTDYTVTIKNSSNAVVAPAELKAIGTYTITFTPISGYASGCVGQTVRSFEIIDGESLDGYVFSKDGDDYLIKNEADLERLAAYVNSGHTAEGLTFKLDVENGITMTAEHTAIGNSSENCQFKGTFNGNNKTISNLTVNKPYETHQGLFGYIGGSAVIQDLTLIDCHITGNNSTGGIVGRAEGTSADASIQISNCHLKNGDIAITRKGVNNIGGIAGYAKNTQITNCTVTGKISTVNSSADVGGIVGSAYGNVSVTSCENTANINASQYCGGIVGFEYYSSNRFTNCFNTGVIEGGSDLGGIVGYYNSRDNFDKCYYAYPCTTEALGGSNYDGKGQRAYLITAGDHIASIDIASGAEPSVPTVTSKITGTKYYKNGNWTLTLGLEANYTFLKYTCEGGTLTNLETADGTHTLTINRNDVTISAIASSNSGVAMTAVTIEDIPDKRWRGTEPIVPELNVSYNNQPLVLGKDYLVEGTNNNAKGEATLTLTGINDYQGTTTKKFKIVDFPLLDPENTTNSSTNPWLIANEEDLEALACIVNTNQRRTGYYLQTKNITLTKEHTAIGTRIDLGNYNYNDYYFEGTYDGGNNNTISGLKINKPSEKYQGLFGHINKATIKNVVIVDCDITGATYTGGVAGYALDSEIKNSSVSGEIKVEGNSKHYHGGIVGTIYRATVEGCVNSATITCNVDAEGYGGIAGDMSRNESKIKDCFNAGVVTGRKYVGSIVGRKLAGTLTNNYHSVETTGGVGAEDAATGTDQEGTGIAATITLGDRVSFVEQPVAFAKVGDVNYYKNGTEVKLAYEVPENKYFDCYSVNSGEISNAGFIDATHTLTGFTANLEITGNVVDTQTDIATATIEAIDDLTFNGQEQHPVPVVTLGDVTLKENTHYTISYDDDCTNAGEKTVTIHGIGRFNSTKDRKFNINPLDISGEDVLTITGLVACYDKTGSEVHPTPTSVTCAATNNATLVLDTDYELSYSGDCILPGDYETILTGKGNYKGEKTCPFSILLMGTQTVCDGTDESTTVPVYGYNANWYQKTEFVMPANELTAMKGKLISAMQFYLKSPAESSWGNARFRVFMKEVENPTISSYSGTEGATIVYDGALDGTQAVMTVNFTTPYFYKGGNLLIGFYEYQEGSWSSATFYGKIIDGTSIGDYSSSLDAVTATQRNFLPKTTFSYGYMSSITFAPEGYATYYDSGYDVVLPAGMKARIVTDKGEGEGQLTYETIADGDTDNKVVPAATGVMLQVAESTEPQTRSIYLDSKTATAYSGTNFLHGSDTETETSGDGLHYKLTYSNNDDNFGWYWGATNGAAFTSPAHKAWLTLPATAARSFFGLPDYDDELTGIKDIEDSAIEGLRFDGAVYTLDGRKVVNSNSSNSKLPKGLYIVNGKKVVVK